MTNENRERITTWSDDETSRGSSRVGLTLSIRRPGGHNPRVTAIGFAKNLKALLKGAKRVVVVAPKRNFSSKRYPKLLGKRLDTLAQDLAKEVGPGDLGGSGSTLTRTEPKTLAIGVLPNTVSRHNAPSRAEAIRYVR